MMCITFNGPYQILGRLSSIRTTALVSGGIVRQVSLPGSKPVSSKFPDRMVGSVDAIPTRRAIFCIVGVVIKVSPGGIEGYRVGVEVHHGRGRGWPDAGKGGGIRGWNTRG